MRLLHTDLIEEFHEEIRKEYPELTLEECNKICSAPFKEVKKGIESGEFPTIRLKFFGTFLSTGKRIQGMLDNYEKMFREHKIAPSVFFKKKEMLEKALTKRKSNESKSKLEKH